MTFGLDANDKPIVVVTGVKGNIELIVKDSTWLLNKKLLQIGFTDYPDKGFLMFLRYKSYTKVVPPF